MMRMQMRTFSFVATAILALSSGVVVLLRMKEYRRLQALCHCYHLLDPVSYDSMSPHGGLIL